MTQDEADILARQNADSFKRQADNGAAMVASINAQAAQLSSRDQEHFLRLYEIHTKLRLGPTVITSTTPDSVVDDIVRDAHRMTQMMWAAIKPDLDARA